MSTNEPMNQEQLDAIQMRLGCDNSTTDDVCTLLDEVERLRALTTVDRDMVERAAGTLFKQDFLERNPWADDARAQHSLEQVRVSTPKAWGQYLQVVRAALDAALNPESSPQPRGRDTTCPYCGNEAGPYTGYVEGLWVCNSEQRDDCYSISRRDEPFKDWARKANVGDPQWGTWRDREEA